MAICVQNVWSKKRWIYLYFRSFWSGKEMSSLVGFEPTTFGLEVRRAIHCATETLLSIQNNYLGFSYHFLRIGKGKNMFKWMVLYNILIHVEWIRRMENYSWMRTKVELFRTTKIEHDTIKDIFSWFVLCENLCLS